MLVSSPELTATSALLRLAPVAKALGVGEAKMPTSGMPMPACWARPRTIVSSRCSEELADCGSMTTTPIVRFAIHLDMASEMSEPEKPKKAAKTRSPERLCPWDASQRSRPSSCAAIDSTRTIARLVARKRSMRFMRELLTFQDGTRPGRRRSCHRGVDTGLFKPETLTLQYELRSSFSSSS